MASFFHQLKVLLWKNWLSIYRQPVWSIVLIFWPVVIFFIMAMTRTKFLPVQASVCYLAPRNLQSTGMIPFLQSFLCNTDTICSNKSYAPNPVTTTSRLKKRFADSGGGGSAFQMRSSTGETASSWDRTVANDWTAAVEIINTGKSVMEDISSGDLKGALCSTINLYPTQQALQQFCQSNETLARFVMGALLSQASNLSSTQILASVTKYSTMVEVLQSKTESWNFLLMLPEYLKNPQSFAYSGEFVLNFSTIPQELSYIQPCVKSILQIINPVIMPANTTNVSNILQTLSNQSLATEMKPCISLFQMLPCESSNGCHAVEQTQTFQIIYWLMTSLTNENSSNACKYNFSSLVCNGSVDWNLFLQSSLTLLKDVSGNSSTAVTRYVQKIWTLLKQNGVNQIIIEKLQQEINNTYPVDTELQSILKETVNLLLNITDVLTMDFTTEQYFGALQAILIKLEKLVPTEQLGNNTGLINNITESIINDVQYWIRLNGLFSSSNVSLQTLVELQSIIESFSTSSTEAVNYFTKFLQILSGFNQTTIQEFTQSLQTLQSLNLVTANITATLNHVIVLFGDIISNPNSNDSFVLADFYLKQILNLLNSDTTLRDSLGLLSIYFNNSQAGDFSRYAAILSIFTPSNLQAVASNPSKAPLALLSLISGFIPAEDQQLFNKVENVLVTLLDSISTCQVELTNCSSSVLKYQQQLYEFIQFISSTSGDVQQFPQLNQFTDGEIKIINSVFSMILCSQAHPNNASCNNVQDIYGELSYIINMTLKTDPNILSIYSASEQFKQNFDNILYVLGSVDLKKLISQLDYVSGLPKCYTNRSVDPLKCTLDLSLSLMDLLDMLLFPQPINDTLVAASSIIRNWLSEVNRTVDAYQQLIYMYDLTSMAYQNQSVLQQIETTLLQIVQTLEELSTNSTLVSQTKEELENIKTQFQTIQWYILYMKNETETFHTSSNIDSFVTLIEVMINKTLSLMKSNPSLVPTVNKIQSVISWLEMSHILPAFQNMINTALQNGGYTSDTFIYNATVVFQQIIQQAFVSGSPWSSFFNQITDSEAKFVLQLLQEYDRGGLNNLSSVMLFTEKVLLAAESFLKDIPEISTLNYNLQAIYNISHQILGIVENRLNQSVLYYVYSLLLDNWSGNIFYEFPLLKTKLMSLLNSSMQCLTDPTMPSIKQNCSSTDITNMLQLILNDLGCQIILEAPKIDGNVTLINIYEYALNSTWEEHINGCTIENSNSKKELACLVETLASTLQFISTINDLSGINSPWVQNIGEALAMVTNKLSTKNITCAAKDSQIIHIIYEALHNQSSHLESLISVFMNQTELYSQNPSEYSKYLIQVFNILKLYGSMHEQILLNETIVNFLYNTMLQLLEVTQNSTSPTRWQLVSSMLNTVNNISSFLKTTDYPIEFLNLLNVVNRVLNLTDDIVTLNANLSHISLVNIFDGNFSMINNLLKQFLFKMNITSVDNCAISLKNLSSLYHNNMNLSINDMFCSNLSSWTCNLILGNNSGFNWLKELESISSMIITSTSGLPADSAMEIITSFTKFVNDTNMNTLEAFLTSIAKFLQQEEPTSNSDVYQSIQVLHSSLQAIIKEALLNRSEPMDEIITINVMGALSSFLRSLNITGYEGILTFASDILQIYFNNRNSTLPPESLAQKVLGHILTSFKESGLEKVAIQALENQIFTQSSEEQKIIQYIISIVMSAINETASSVALQPLDNKTNTMVQLFIQMLTENQSNTTVLSQLENWINATHIFNENNQIHGLNISEVINSLMKGNLNNAQVEEILWALQNVLSAQNITDGSDIFHLYEFFVGILNQTIAIGPMNLTQMLQPFLTMDCEGISKVINSVYIMIQRSSASTTWPVNTFVSNLTMDMCQLLQGNYSQNNWINILHTSRECVAFVTPLLPVSVRKYFAVVDDIIKVASDLIADPTISLSKISSIMNIVSDINELFNNASSSPNWTQNTVLNKLVYFLVDLAWTSASDKELLLFKTQNFFLDIIQDIQNMLKLQNGSPNDVWISFALDVMGISINTTQNTSLEERFLNKVWDSFKQNGLENVIISTISHLWPTNGSASSENAYILEHFIQLVFNITDMIISETPSNMTTNTIGKAVNIVLNDLFQILLAQNKNISLLLDEGLQYVNMTTILNELETLITSLTIMNIPQSISNESAILVNLLNALNQSNVMNIIGNIAQILTTSDNVKYIKTVMGALEMFGEFVHMNNSTDIQEFSSILVKYLPIYLDTSNQTQTSVMPILNLWQQFTNITNTQIRDTSTAIVELLPLFKSHFLLNESIDVRNLSSWLVGIIAQLTPPEEQTRLENAANATLLLIQSIQECNITPMTCTGLTKVVEKFMSDLIQLELAGQNATLVNNSLLQFGSFNQSDIKMINEVFLVLSYALGYPSNSTNGNALFEEFSALTNLLLNTTIMDNLNITSLSSLKNIVDVLNSANVTQILLQTENLLHAYICMNQTDANPLLCKLNVTFKLTQLMNLLPLAQSTHEGLAIITSITEQWLSKLNINTSIYEQLIDLYNVTVLTFQYYPTLQAINTSLVNIVHILQDMGLLLNTSLHGYDTAVNLLSEMVKVESKIVYSVSNSSQLNISELLETIKLELDTVNWLLLQAENQTGTSASFPGAYTMHTVTQWIIQNYQQLTIIVKDVEGLISSFNSSSPNTTIDALKAIVEDFLIMFPPQTEDVQLIESLETVINVTDILLQITSQDTLNKLETFINSLKNSAFQFNISNGPSTLFNILSGLNQTDFIFKIAKVIQGVTGRDVQYGKMFRNALMMYNDLIQLNNTTNMQDLSAIFTKYLSIFSSSMNQTQADLNVILNLWQYLINLTEKQSNLNQVVIDILPFFQSHMFLNGSIDVSYLASGIVNLISQYIPPTEKDMFEHAANASLLLIQTCSVTPMTCTGFVEDIQKFVSDVTQLELMIQNKTLVNSSLLQEFGSFSQSQITLINNIFLMLSQASGSPYNFSNNGSGIFEEFFTLTRWFLNATNGNNINITSITSLQNIIEMLKSINITQVLLQSENLLRTYNCSNSSDVEQLQCKLNMTFYFTQFLNNLPLEETTRNKLAAISSVAEQWLSQLNNNISIYQQLTDLYNVTILAFQYQPTLQVINTSLVGIVQTLQDMGVLLNFNLNESDFAIKLLSEMTTVNSKLNIFSLSSLSQLNITEVLEILRLELDTVNWLLVRLENQTGASVTSPGAFTMQTINQWIMNHYQQISLIIKDIESASNSFTLLAPNSSVDALKTIVEDILTAFLPQTENAQLTEILQTVLNVTKILLDVTSQDTISQLEMFVKTLVFQFDISTDPGKLFNMLSFLNQTDRLSQIVKLVKSVIASNNIPNIKVYLDALKMFNDLLQLNNTINIQDISNIITRYLPIYMDASNQMQNSSKFIFNFLQYLLSSMNTQSGDLSKAVAEILPLFQTHILFNESTDIYNLSSWLVGLISQYIQPTEQDRFEKVANATLLLIQSMQVCSTTPMMCTGLIDGVQKFVSDVTQLELIAQNETLINSTLLQFGSYNQSQIAIINKVFLVLSHATGYSLNASTDQTNLYEEILILTKLLLNTTIKDNLNTTTSTSLKKILKVLTSTNITQFLLQAENIIHSYTCSNPTSIECRLNVTFQFTHLLQLVPLAQSTQDNLGIIYSVAEQWLSQVNSNLSASQKLADLYNVTILALQYHYPILQAINTSLVNTVTILKDIGIFNFNLNTTDLAISILFDVIQKVDSEISMYSLTDVLQYNISNTLENIKFQLDTVNWLLLWAKNKSEGFNGSTAAIQINTTAKWLITISELITSFNRSSIVTDLLHILSLTMSDKPIQGLIQQAGTEIQSFMNISFIRNLFMNQNIQKDAEIALMLLQEINRNNISYILSSINQVIQTVQGVQGLELAYQLYSNTTTVKILTIVKEGMRIINEIEAKGTIGKEAIYEIYNFTYMLVQGEWNWVPFQNISAMEAELLDVFYMAMKPFLGGNWTQVYTGNCSPHDVLQILVQTVFKNATTKLTLENTTCDWQLIYNNSEISSISNQSLGDMIYLALQSSPVFNNVCSKDSLHPLAEELACLMQAMRLSISLLADLTKISGLQIPLIQSLNDSLTFICNNMPVHNSTFQQETQLLNTLNIMFLNQSNPMHIFIQFLIDHYSSPVEMSDLQQMWAQISKIIDVLAPINSSLNANINELVAATANMTVQPGWFESWQILNKLIAMNWTAANIDVSLAALNQLRKAIILIDSGLDIKTIQIYQTIVSLMKNYPVINDTMSLTPECTSALSAVVNLFHSIWTAFDPTNTYLDKELLSNFSLLVCDSFHIQPANISTWISPLETFKNILPYLATNTSTDIVNYITGLEKIIMFVSDAVNSQNISQEIMFGGVYKVFIQELKIFSNDFIIADWIEMIPVNQIIPSFTKSITVDQTIAIERDILLMLSKTLNATSYSEGISMLSDLVANLSSSTVNQSTATSFIQQLLNLIIKFTVTVQVPPLAEPYGTVMNCLKNVTQDLSSNLSGHLEEAIQLAKDLFTQSNESANASAIPDLLKQKMYQLHYLSSIICGLEGSNNSLTYCYMPCQYISLLQDVGNLLSSGANVTKTAISSPAIITSFLGSLWQVLENEMSVQLSTLLPVSDLSNITASLSQFINTTSTNFEAILANVFRNSSHVENELAQFVKLNQSSITALMNVPIPDNKTDIGTWFTILNQCSNNASLVAKPFQVFCNLTAEQGYEMAIIFLENVDLLKLFYRLAVPSTWQTSFDLILSALQALLNKVDSFLKDIPSEEEISNLLSLIKNFTGVSTTSSTRRKRSLDPSGTLRASTLSFTTLSRIVCSGNTTLLSQALYSMYTSTRSATNFKSGRAQTIYETYGIPTDNAFCANLFLNLVESTSGAATWMLMKPLLYGQILYTPHTDVTEKIMNKTKNSLLQVEDYMNTVKNISKSIQPILTNWPFMKLAQQLIGTIKTLLNNTVISGVLEDFLNLNVTDLSEKLNKTDSFISLVGDNLNLIQAFQNICDVLLNLMSCVSYDRLQPMNSIEEMMTKANQLQGTNNLFAAVSFNLSSGSSRQKRDLSNMPKHISYSITMRSLLSENTNTIRDSFWVPGPHSSTNMYSRGFVYLQENIDRAIIEMQTNKSVDNVAVQFQPMPYPCYTKDSFLFSMSFSLPIALMITWVLFIASFVKKLVHEKELRLHEYMKMMGVSSCNHFFAWFIESASFLTVTVSILVIILKFGKILTLSNGFILFLFFLDYSLTIIAMSFLISVFFHNTNVAGLSGSLIYIITFFPFIVVVSKESSLSFAGKTLLSLFSPTALSYATQYAVRFEEQNEGIQWHNMYTSTTLNDSFSFGWLCWIMLIDSMIYFMIGWYIKIVFPGQYGIGAVWYFPVLPSFWMECCGFQSVCSKKPSGLLMSNIVEHGVSEKKGDELYPYKEKDPTDLNLGVSLHGLTKEYKSKVAVQNLNLNFYEGHITSLLGHNGAGKTTTLSMLTGLFSATSGTIYVYGEDIRTRLSQVRKNLGVCMQYDVLFDHLTTKEHLLLYGSIKAPKWNKTQLHEEVKRTLKETGLYSHRHKPVKTLSGGMKRKLSICIALIGGSKVVVLDEPTTGVDPCSRRSIWEVISKNKKDKTIILSTHHLDEAEILSDRIAFLEQGGLRCCGTPMFLKEKFGSGYHLTLTKKFPNQKDDRLCDTERVTALIQSHIPEATLKEDVGGELVYVLPPFRAEISSAYLSLLRNLDANMHDLSLGCYGISDTTIEEVFLKLTDGLDEDDQNFSHRAVPIPSNNYVMEDEASTSSYSFTDNDDRPLTKKERVKGVKLFFKKVGAIFIKRFHNSRRNWKGLISQILLPVLFVIAAMGLGSLSASTAEYPKLLLSPEMYGTTEQAVVFGINNKNSESLMNSMFSFPGIDNFCLDNAAQCLPANSLGSWNNSDVQMSTYNNCNCTAGIMSCDSFGGTPPHRMTFSKQMLYDASGTNMENYLLATTLQYIQKRYGGWSYGLPNSQIKSFLPLPENLTLSKVWYNNEGRHSLPAFLNSFSNFLLRANLPSDQAAQYSISVYNQPLPGSVSQSSTTITLVNTLVALSVLVGYSITTASFVTYVVKEYDNGSKRLQHIAGVGEVLYWITSFLYDLAIYFIPVGLSIAMIAAFKLPAFYNYPNLGGVSLLFILFGYATFAWMYLIAGTFKNAGMAFITYVCINLFIGINTIISSSVVYMLLQQTSTTDEKYQSLNTTYTVLTNIFKVFPQFCFGYGLIELAQQQAIQDQLAIFGSSEKVNVFDMDILGYMFVAMTVQGTFCFLLRLLINDGIIYSVKTFFKKLFKLYPRIVKDPDEDEDVKAERDRVDSGCANEDLLVLEGLTKVYHQVNKKVFAVNNTSLGIPPGECFGLLGVNGAGKTTTFKMLTGDTSPSSGNIQVRNYMGNMVNVLGFNTEWSSFGYCPQEDALDELMTGLEHLYYYARIHGIPEKRIKSVSNQLLHKLQLVQYKDRITGSYSCGTRRKLSTALALIGKPSILLLDEPSSGMDPKTKRHLWKIISEEIQEKCAVVLTSHSMEECEALCTRLAIMVKGKFQCIGSLQHVKSRFGSGFTVKMHLKDSSIIIKTITDFMHFHFPNTYLKDHHFTMAEYHVPMSVGGVACIFDLLEANKTALNIINFSVSQTTLDEVFINFAQAQTTPDNSSLGSGSSQDLRVVVA
ncbi:ATP-binding cassette sub-family A member 12 [Rana temporaria]|uniref:ATP-binding cassette sub-family A member 12 n=1 Tax=Rana temporaria TaxID=8407 RepID=UPI001AADFB17|nr:ATP-binding cassette sub-family A member 12 [Rana temporaria]